MMKIYCDNLVEFLDVIESLVKKGLTFKAYTRKFEIELLGGF